MALIFALWSFASIFASWFLWHHLIKGYEELTKSESGSVELRGDMFLLEWPLINIFKSFWWCTIHPSYLF
jgi:hypothetical protein